VLGACLEVCVGKLTRFFFIKKESPRRAYIATTSPLMNIMFLSRNITSTDLLSKEMTFNMVA
jgi:hypothetical protein